MLALGGMRIPEAISPLTELLGVPLIGKGLVLLKLTTAEP